MGHSTGQVAWLIEQANGRGKGARGGIQFDQKSLKIHNHQMYEWTLIQSFKKKFFFFFFGLAMLGMWDLSSLTWNRTSGPCSGGTGSVESQPQEEGSPSILF